jgi:solute:Na+ symporter, SSS family
LNGIDVAIIMVYFAGMILIGLYAGKKQKGVDDYYLGGRSMGSFKIGTLWMAGWIGGSSVIGTSSNGYSLGITGVWYVSASAIGCIIFAFAMAKPIKRISQKINNITFPELISSRYDSKNGTMASITTILAMVGYTAAQFVAGASILNVLTGWNLGLCYGIAAVVIVFYVSTGGLLAVTYTDIVQMALLILGVVVIAVPLCASTLARDGVSLHDALPASYFDPGAWGWPKIIALGLSTIMSFFTCMDSFTRCIAAKDAKTAKVGTLYAAVLVIIIAGASTYLGMAGKVILPNLASSNNVVAALVVEIFPHGLKGLILIGVLSAIMSTADISVLTGSASMAKDIYQRFLNPKATDGTLLKMGFVCSLLVGLLGAIFGWFNQDIMNILLITFTINSAGLFLPTVGAFFWKKSCSAGSFASMVSATLIAVIWLIGGKVSSLPLFSIDALWPSFGVSAVLYFTICLTHRKTPEEIEKAEMFFAAKGE